jgi:hypothetical protein
MDTRSVKKKPKKLKPKPKNQGTKKEIEKPLSSSPSTNHKAVATGNCKHPKKENGKSSECVTHPPERECM